MSTGHKTPNIDWQPLLNLGLLVMLWGVLSYQLAYEWSHSEQYSYGLFVPFLALYLIYLRWEDRPEPVYSKSFSQAPVLLFLGLVIVAHYPISIIFEANADWRLLAWSQALLILITTYLLLWRWGGVNWLKHFGFPFFFMLIAIPWPRWVEHALVLHLMDWVALMTVETVNFLGTYAKQSGNIIILKTGVVSVEEACSGVRSFQSTLMAAFFLGELMRFGGIIRGGIVFAGACFAVFFNFIRTLSLTLISAHHGADVMDRWHDTAGYLVFFLSLGSLGLLCLLLRKFSKRRVSSKQLSQTSFHIKPNWLPIRPLAILVIFLLISEPFTSLWYAIRGPESRRDLVWSVDWNEGTQDLQFEEIDDRIHDVLFFDEGEMLTWKTPNKFNWIAFFFSWDSGKAAQLGGVHNPELCLPAVGWVLDENPADLVWQGPEGLELIFNSYRFHGMDREVYVFYCQWDPQGYPYHTKAGRFRLDRIHDAWIGDRKAGKQKLEIITEGPKDMAEAKNALVNFLNQSIQVGKFEPATG